MTAEATIFGDYFVPQKLLKQLFLSVCPAGNPVRAKTEWAASRLINLHGVQIMGFINFKKAEIFFLSFYRIKIQTF